MVILSVTLDFQEEHKDPIRDEWQYQNWQPGHAGSAASSETCRRTGLADEHCSEPEGHANRCPVDLRLYLAQALSQVVFHRNISHRASFGIIGP